MGEFTSYWLYQKYVSTDSGQTYVPVYPAEYSVNGDGTMPLSAKSEYDEACGYVPPTPTAIYRWVDMDISTDYICDECGQYPFKLYATYSDSSDYTVDCNSSTTLTQGEAKIFPAVLPSSSITSVIVGDCVETIGYGAFINGEGSNISSITISNNVISIESYAFDNCKKLVSINIPSGVTSIEEGTFTGCYILPSINIPSGVTSIGDYSFSHCSGLTSVSLSEGLTNIGDSAFIYCSSLQTISIPNTVTSIGELAFSWCSGLTSINIPSGVTSIEQQTFYHCRNLSSINMPSGITSIGSWAFGYCGSLSYVILPDNLTTIGESAFYGCSGLTSITIPSGVTSLGTNSFRNCSGFTSVTINAITPPTITPNGLGQYGYMFHNTNNCPIYVPAASVNTYKTATNWSTYASRIQAIS